MIAPTPQLTAWLSVLLGAYLIAGGFGALLRGEIWPEIVGEFERSPGLVMVTGAVAFAVGSLIVTFHNDWSSPAAILVTLAGWGAVIEGLTLLAIPQIWLRVARPMMAAPRLWGGLMLLLGAYLLSTGIMNGPFGLHL